MENKNTIAYRIMELEAQAPHAKGLAELSRINLELDSLREQLGENEMLGEYETGCTVEEYFSKRRVRW
jgi:hypothetical protein